MGFDLPLLAGTLSTGMFVTAALPMLVKAARTKEMASYSVANLVMSNVGNALYAVYIVTTPPGPAWMLHAFNMVVGVLMLGWWLRYGRPPAAGRPRLRALASSPTSTRAELPAL